MLTGKRESKDSPCLARSWKSRVFSLSSESESPDIWASKPLMTDTVEAYCCLVDSPVSVPLKIPPNKPPNEATACIRRLLRLAILDVLGIWKVFPPKEKVPKWDFLRSRRVWESLEEHRGDSETQGWWCFTRGDSHRCVAAIIPSGYEVRDSNFLSWIHNHLIIEKWMSFISCCLCFEEKPRIQRLVLKYETRGDKVSEGEFTFSTQKGKKKIQNMKTKTGFFFFLLFSSFFLTEIHVVRLHR